MKPIRPLLSSFLTVCLLGGASAQAQTWNTTTSGSQDWSVAGNWSSDPSAPSSGTTTAIQFFAAPGTVIPAASAIVANQNIATPFILNSLVVNGTGPASGVVPSLTINGGGLQFDGTNPSIQLNPNYGGPGYTVSLNSALTFNAPTSITFGNGGGFINTGGAWNGSGAVTFTGGLTNRPLSLTNATGTTFTGDVFLTGNGFTVLQLNAVNGVLGANASPSTQSVVVNSGAGVNMNYGNGAYTNAQNFVINGSGNAGTTSAAINVTRINFGNSTIGGLAVATDSTFRIAMENPGDARVVNVSRGIVGSGKLIKTGNGYLQPSVVSPATVTWGGSTYTSYTGNIEIREGAIQTPAVSNSLGSNTGLTQRVTVSSGAAAVISAGNNAWTQPQNFILNGSGTGYAANVGGLAALDSFGAGFGSNTVRRIVVATDSTISARRDGSASGLARGLITLTGLSGAGNLTINGPYGTAISPVYLNFAASDFEEFAAFSGRVNIQNGILSIGHVDALGTAPAGQVTLGALGAIASGITGGLDQAFLSRIDNLASTSGAVCLGLASANNLDFSSAPNLRLGATGALTYSGTLTPAGGVYRLGGGGGTLTVSSKLTGSNSLVVSGAVTLSNATNDFNGGITLSGNNTGLGQTPLLSFTGGTGSLNGNAVQFGGIGGTLAYTGSATGSTDTIGAVAFNSGHGTITSTRGAAGTTVLALSSLGTRTSGATGSFTVTGGTNGTDHRITVGGLATGFIDQGTFFGGSNYAFYDATGFLRAPTYGTDAGFVTSGAATSVAGSTHQQITGALSAQTSATFNTFRISGAVNVTLAASQTLTLNGLLKAGNNATTLSGGSGIQAGSNAELVIRADQGSDAISINCPVLANGTNPLTKTGAGTLTLSGANTYTGTTSVVAGTLTVGSLGSLADTAAVVVNGGTYATNNSTDAIASLTLKNGVIAGTGIHQASAYALENGAVTGRLGGGGALTKTTDGMVLVSGVNNYTGGTVISGGTFATTPTGRLDDTGSVTIQSGAVYEIGGPDSVGDVILENGSIRGQGLLTSAYFDVRNGTISAPIAGNGAMVKSTAGTVTLSSPGNTFRGDVEITGGAVVLADNGRLNFKIDSTFTNWVNGSGSFTANGDFNIDLSSANLTDGNTWTLVDPALTESYGATFSIPGFTETADVWTKVDGANTWTFSEATGVLTLDITPPGGFNNWIAGFSGLGDVSPGGDPDSDGIDNLMEYVLNGNPGQSDPQILPDLDSSGSNFVFTFVRRIESFDDTVQVFQYNTDLGPVWQELAIPQTSAAGVVITPVNAVTEQVQVTVPKGANVRMFGRVKASQP